MTQNEYRELIVDLDKLAKKVQLISNEFGGDKNMILYHVRYIGHLLGDIRMIMDLKENPNKMHLEMTPRKPTEVNGEASVKEKTIIP